MKRVVSWSAGIAIAGIALAGIGNVVVAAPKPQARAEIFTRLLDCRAVTDSAERLACYDRQVAAMDLAAQRDEVVVLDKEEVRKTRRSLFGFSLPRLPFLNGSDDDDENAKPENNIFESKIETVRRAGENRWLLKLEDGAEWQTTEPMPHDTPAPGMKIVIKRAAMGSFLGSMNGKRSVRMKRVG